MGDGRGDGKGDELWEVGGEVGDSFETEEVGVVVFLSFFVCPYHFEGDVGGIAAELEDGCDVAFETVSHHEELVDADAEGAAEFPVLSWCFVRDHFYTVEVVPQSGAQEFVLLVEDFTFGEDHHFVFRSCPEYLDGLLHARQRCGRYIEEAPSKALYLEEAAGADAPVAHLHSVFHQ